LSPTKSVQILPLNPSDLEHVQAIAHDQWGDHLVVVHGCQYFLDQLPGFKAIRGESWLGLTTYSIEDETCEIVSLDSFLPRQGIGRQLVQAVQEAARKAGCKKLVLITTNDNLNAMGFYQKIGFQMVWVQPDAVTRSRKIKPSIPLMAENGLPIRDEITFEMKL
jgi:GNAT superfamily N-acetyltransferase